MSGKPLNVDTRGWIPVAVSKRNYLRLETRLQYKKESWDSVITRVLDSLEEYENQYPPVKVQNQPEPKGDDVKDPAVK